LPEHWVAVEGAEEGYVVALHDYGHGDYCGWWVRVSLRMLYFFVLF
jgi:hypothetical protein